jgi:PPOX class probable F420-dependent enzyme
MTATIDRATAAGARAIERLASEKIGWLTSVNPDGQPQSSPLWFLWANGEIVIYSGKRAPRNGNIGDRPLVSFNLNSDAEGGDVVTMEGVARIDEAAPPASADTAFLAKYRGILDGYGWTPEYYAGEYPVFVRVTPTRWRVG